MAHLRTVPIPRLTPGAYGTVSVGDATARKNVRIFRREGSEWFITQNDYKFTQNQLQLGLNLGIDARDTRRPGGWGGRINVRFTVHDRGKISADSVKLRVAPILTYHHSQSVQQIFTTAGNDTSNFFQSKFVSTLEASLAEMDVNYPLFEFNASDDLWAQDFFEPGYTSMPGPSGPVTLQVMIRSAQGDRVAGRQVFEYLRGSGTGAVQDRAGSRDEINSMGNLETIPPHNFNGKNYPAGRIVLGTHGAQKPYILKYMLAQEIQDPLLFDTNWLAAGLAILRKTQSTGYGNIRAFSRQNDTEGNPSDLFGILWGLHGVPSYTIDDLLSQSQIIEANANFARSIRGTVNLLKRETGIKNADIHGVPAVFRTGLTFLPNGGIRPERNNNSELAGSLYPASINGLILSTQYLAPNPWGPVVDGRDIMADAVSEVYGRLGFKVNFVDNWNSHHTWGGEVHCATNTIRNGSYRWW
ncbi:arginine deiminase type-4 [Histoplasma capsulatum]|uniref:Arginine deiminase type-4 n=1 Tax=Ajellomyces capsulatus TaxID=5037 RepID=A0A8A1M553_AJECA|nr:arginine deiminase type-4 [Histoplasma capsulatum]